MEEIKNRFSNAYKVFGNSDEITTASGVRIKGRYVLTESGAVTPSHDPLNGFRKSDGFPTDENGQTVNDRDYERDTDAQEITRQIAGHYDNRALQTPIVVSDGIVLSGNGRTMAGMLAAANNTDAGYIIYLKSYPEKYGFSLSDIDGFSHPRVVFETEDRYPLNAETFAMFNAQEIKSQSKTEQAVKMGKLVDTETFNRIVRNINTFDTIGDFYNDKNATTEAVNELVSAGIISRMQYPEMFDGDSISQNAKEILENVLIGKAFESSPDAIRQITAFKGVRRNIITALAEISNNLALNEYSLNRELSQAIALCYQARANGCFHQGDIVSGFARQMTMFGDSETVADFRDSTVMLLADIVNHSQVTRLKKMYAVYNHQAADAASGQTDMFSTGEVKSKEEILNEVKELFGTKKELDAALSEAADSRKSAAEDSIWLERAKEFTRFSGQYDQVSSNGVCVGQFAEFALPCGDSIIVKLELLSNGIAGIRLRGFTRIKVNEELLMPTSETHCTLPDWLIPTVPKDKILEVLLSYRKAA
jgi:hypothetical protein